MTTTGLHTIKIATNARNIGMLQSQAAGAAPLNSPVFTGDPRAPTPPTADNDTSIATTAFVKNQGYAPLANPTFTGDPKAPTPATADNDTSIATTAFVKAQGYIVGNQTITLSGDVTGSGATAITATLATVNSNVGTFQGITVNGKGLVTAAANQNYAPLASPTFSGTVGIGTASTGTGSAQRLSVVGNAVAGQNCMLVATGPTGSDTTSYLIVFNDGPLATFLGGISRNGASTVNYGTSSDARLKENLVQSKAGLDAVMLLKVYDYAWKGTGEEGHGFVAQEMFKVYPYAVRVGGEDPARDPWMIDHGRLTPLLVRAIQQLAARVDELEKKDR